MNRLCAYALAAMIGSSPAVAMDDSELAALVAERLHGDRSEACLAVAVIDGQQVSRARVCADAEAEPRIGPQHAFEIGSISKTMTAALLAQLIQDGSVSMDDPLPKYLPEGTVVPDFEGQPILLRHVVTHTSGIPALPSAMSTASPLNPYATLSEEALLASLADVTLTAAPGTDFAYSNFASMVLSLVVARESGVDLEALLQQELFEPLGMNGAYITQPPEGLVAAAGHLPGGRPAPAWTFAENLAGVGGVRATLDDMVRYAQAQLGHIEAPISAALKLSQQPVEGSVRPMAMNWMLAPLAGRQVHVHEGGTGGFSSFMAFDTTRDRAVVVLSDTAMTALGGLGSVGNHLLDEALPLGEPRRHATPDPELLDALLGRYVIGGGLAMELTRKDDVLVIQAQGQPAFEMGYDSAGDFFPKAFDALLTPQKVGDTWSFRWSQGGGVMAARRLDVVSFPAPSAEALQAYVGEYPLSPQFAIVFTVRDSLLHAQATGQGMFPLDAIGEDQFAAAQYGIEIQFHRDDAGAVSAMTLRQGGGEQRAEKK